MTAAAIAALRRRVSRLEQPEWVVLGTDYSYVLLLSTAWIGPSPTLSAT